MRISGLDAVPGKASAAPENAVKTVPAGSVNTSASPAKEVTVDEESRNEWQVSESFLRKAVEKANESMVFRNRYLEFRIHEKTNEIMVRIIDSETKEVVREIPSEKMLDMFASMLELAGLLVDERR
ncbi:MAG: flagellar protein FlaG [Clostridiaceae bacterium]|jgi:flagellar protein FlaG|nr:flagellar protein FlaG [Clostridiaceae bacterium]HPU45493.1 flagellar protein FlaG [Thermoclostridium sp.]